jgi:hypothetical protein
LLTAEVLLATDMASIMNATQNNIESPYCQELPELQLWREVLLLAITDWRGQSVGVKSYGKRSGQLRARAWSFFQK